MIGLDVHMIVSDTTAPEYVQQAIASVKRARDCASYPVSLHIVHGVAGHVGIGRQRGYSRGHHPYVTFVDDDDYVLDHAFETIRSALEQTPDAVFTREWLLQNGVMIESNNRHHLAVYKREVATAFDFPQWVVDGDLALKHTLMRENAAIIDVPDPVYVWRVYMSKGRALRTQHSHEMQVAYGR